MRFPKMYASSQNICASPKYMRMSIIYTHFQNICACPKYMRISKIYAHFQKYMRPKLCGIVKYMRLHNIRYIPDGRWNLCAYQNIRVHQKIGAQTLTIWARQNLQLLTSSKSGWRALVQVMLSPPCSPQVIWAPRPPSLYGRRLSRTVPVVVPARLAKISASCPNICGRIYFNHFLGKNQKPNSAHKCPITSLQIRT